MGLHPNFSDSPYAPLVPSERWFPAGEALRNTSYDKLLPPAVELTDFSVNYTQGLVDSITAELKAGKGEVVCEKCQLIKVSKNKDGVVTHDVLTKKWTDWVDYWAVDFDY